MCCYEQLLTNNMVFTDFDWLGCRFGKTAFFFSNFLKSNFTMLPKAYDRHFPLHSHKSKQINDSSDDIFLLDKTVTSCYKKKGGGREEEVNQFFIASV